MQTWQVSYKRRWWLGLLLVLTFIGLVVTVIVVADIPWNNTKGGPNGLVLLVFGGWALWAFSPAKGTLELRHDMLTIRRGRRVNEFPLRGAVPWFGKWTQHYMGVRGTCLYLETTDGNISVGGEGFLFKHPAWYRVEPGSDCDVSMTKEAFAGLHEMLGARLSELAPPPAPLHGPDLPRGYREPGREPTRDAPAIPPPWLQIELEPNPAAAGASVATTLTTMGFVGFGVVSYVSIMLLAETKQIDPMTALGMAIFAMSILVCAAVLVLRRKTYRLQLLVENGVVRFVRTDGRIFAQAPLSQMYVEPAVHRYTSRVGAHSLFTLVLRFPQGKQLCLGCYAAPDWGMSVRQSGCPDHFVGPPEWEPLVTQFRGR